MKRKISLIQTWGHYLAKRQGGWECHYCEVPIAMMASDEKEIRHLKRMGFAKATVDHKIPKSKGGNDAPKNLVLCCDDCNKRKASMDYKAFVELLKSDELNNG